MDITYEASLRLKGIAILMMIWLHCFNNWQNPEYAYTSLIFVGEYPLVYRLTYITGVVVPLYCILSGYGLSRKKNIDMRYIKTKISNLLCQNWFVLTIFVTITIIIKPNYYYLSIKSLLGNYIGYDVTFNGTLWFMLPYILLFVTFPLLIKILRAKKCIWPAMTVILIFFIFANWGLKLEAKGMIHLQCYGKLLLNYFKLLFPFSLGSIFALYSLPENWKCFINRNKAFFLIMLTLIILTKLFVPSYTLCFFYVVPVFFFLYLLKMPVHIDRLFKELGCNSMYMWFIHGYFTYYIFHDYIFLLRYPLLIYIVTVVISYGLSRVLGHLYQKLSLLIRVVR